MRALLTRLFAFMLRTFYRRIEVVGVENIPPDRGVLFAVNHPNGLVDPLFVLCFAGRPVSFLGKAPLFTYPVIGWFVRKLETIPVYRKQDLSGGEREQGVGESGRIGELRAANRETFARAREVLARDGGVAIFPEGTTHSDPRLRELKTGAARIALGAGVDLAIVPGGIYYSSKGTFRSDALVVFGKPIAVEAQPVDVDGEPSPVAVDSLTETISSAMAAVTLQADSHAALELVAQAEDIFSGADPQGVAEEFTLRRQFIDGYHFLAARDPERLARLQSAVTRFSEELGRANLEPHELVPRFRAATVARVVVQLPLAVAGAIVNYVPYRLIGALARRFARGDDEMTATMKFVGSLVLYPLTWIIYAALAWRVAGPAAAGITLVVVPFLGYVAVRVLETADVLVGRVRAMTRRGRYARLVAMRNAIRTEFLAVAREMAADKV